MFLFLATLLTTPEKFPLTIDSIMRGYELVGHAPSQLRWSEDGKQIGFLWGKAVDGKGSATKSYIVGRDGKGLMEGTLPTEQPKPWARGSKLDNRIAYESGGDIWIRDNEKDTTENLTKSNDFESNPIFVRDGKTILFTKSGDLYQLTSDGNNTKPVIVGKAGLSGDKPFTIDPPDNYRRGSMSASPSGTHIAVTFLDTPAAAKNAQVARFISDSGYVELQQTYQRVGAPQGHSLLKFYNLSNGTSVELKTPKPGNFGQFQWAPDGKHGVVWGYSEDHKDGWLYCFNCENDTLATIWNERNAGWIGGPLQGLLGWFPNSQKVYFGSENTGYSTLKTADMDSTKSETLVGGTFEVSQVRLDSERNRFTFVSSEGSPYDRHIDSVNLDGSNKQKLADFSAGDDATYAFSPDGSELAIVKSTSNRPAELFVNKVQVTTTPSDEWLKGPWIDPPIITVPSRDGVHIPAKLFKPKNWRKGGPAVVFVHGAGYLQNVFHGWSYYFREYMFHHVLMDKGYAVLDIDYRASAGYGSAWRTAIYRHMGGHDLEDVVDGAKYLVKELGAAPDRLGVYGGSYGGFITLMAMFTTPDVFKSGAALRPVGDWANYHHGYTSPILNTPQEDPEAYKVSSPINFVEGLKGNLLICHGMMDVNVQFQDSIRVVQRLIELRKKNWWVAPYPVEDHAFVRPESWADEYQRIFDLFEQTIGNQRKK